MTNEQRYHELWALMTGDKLGEGLSREVYDYLTPECWSDDRNEDGSALYLGDRVSHVLKVEKDGGLFQNVQEWSVWTMVRNRPALAKWFAPCRCISPCGKYLVMAKCEPLRKKDMPKKLPAFLVDVRPENLGMYQGRIVACDYGCGFALIRTASKRMVNVREWPKT